MAEFDCPNGDGRCTASDLSVGVVNGEFFVGGKELITALFPDFDPLTWRASRMFFESPPRELAAFNIDVGSELSADEWLLATKALAGHRAAELASATINLASASGVIANCTPCGDTWIYEE